eukprot:945794-Pleurochrysis_carterae.AAC.1
MLFRTIIYEVRGGGTANSTSGSIFIEGRVQTRKPGEAKTATRRLCERAPILRLGTTVTIVSGGREANSAS